jgi:hypothetical protein
MGLGNIEHCSEILSFGMLGYTVGAICPQLGKGMYACSMNIPRYQYSVYVLCWI